MGKLVFDLKSQQKHSSQILIQDNCVILRKISKFMNYLSHEVRSHEVK